MMNDFNPDYGLEWLYHKWGLCPIKWSWCPFLIPPVIHYHWTSMNKVIFLVSKNKYRPDVSEKNISVVVNEMQSSRMRVHVPCSPSRIINSRVPSVFCPLLPICHVSDFARQRVSKTLLRHTRANRRASAWISQSEQGALGLINPSASKPFRSLSYESLTWAASLI